MSRLDHRLIARGFRLEGEDRRSAARALGWLIAATVAVRVLSYGRLTQMIAKIPPGRTPRTAITPEDCSTAIRRASSIWPAACLPQAVAGYCLLRRAGRDAALKLGVAVDGPRLDAHAWLECDGVVIVGDQVGRPYSPLAAAGRQTP